MNSRSEAEATYISGYVPPGQLGTAKSTIQISDLVFFQVAFQSEATFRNI